MHQTKKRSRNGHHWVDRRQWPCCLPAPDTASSLTPLPKITCWKSEIGDMIYGLADGSVSSCHPPLLSNFLWRPLASPSLPRYARRLSPSLWTPPSSWRCHTVVGNPDVTVHIMMSFVSMVAAIQFRRSFMRAKLTRRPRNTG